MFSTHVENDARELEQDLLPSGTLLWHGRPLLRVIFHPADLYLVPFSLLLGGFSLFWESMFTHGKSSPFFILWGIPFAIVGLYLIWRRFFYDAWLKQRTVYAVTTQRVLIIRYGLHLEQTDRTLEYLPAISLTVRRDGVGTIDFSTESMLNPSLTKNRNATQPWSPLRKFTFVDIPDARNVRALLLNQRRKLVGHAEVSRASA